MHWTWDSILCLSISISFWLNIGFSDGLYSKLKSAFHRFLKQRVTFKSSRKCQQLNGKKKKDWLKFQWLEIANYFFYKTVKSLCVMFQNQLFLHRDVLNQITNHLCYSLLAGKTRRKALLEQQSDESHDWGRRVASALRVHMQAAAPGSGRELGGARPAMTPARGQPVCRARAPRWSASITTFTNGARKW